MDPIFSDPKFTVAITNTELQQINGGTVQEGYAAGHAAGEYIRNLIEGVLFLSIFK